MNILSQITLEKRKKDLGKLKTDYGLYDMKNRDLLLAFIQDNKKIEGIDIDQRDGDLDGPLVYIACRQNDYELFRILLDRGAKTNQILYGISFFDAILQWTTDIRFYRYLESIDFDYNMQTESGKTGLLSLFINISHNEYMYRKNEKNSFTMLRDFYLTIEKKIKDIDNGGQGHPSPIMIAAVNSAIDTMLILINKGSNIKTKKYIGENDKEMNCLEFYEYIINKNEMNENEEVLRILSK